MPRIKKKRVEYLTKKEFLASLNAIDGETKDYKEYRAVISILYLFGCRISEALMLRKKDIRLIEDTLFINMETLKTHSKSGLPAKRELPVHKDNIFVKYIKDYFNSSEVLHC